MKKWLFLLLLSLVSPAVLAQRGGGVQNPVNLLPACTATTGSCPAQDYFCRDANEYIVYCRNSVWTWIKAKEPIVSTDCTPYIAEGQLCWDSDNDIFYMGNGTAAQAAGGGAGGTSTIQEDDVTRVAQANTLDFRTGLDVTESPTGEANVSVNLLQTVPAFSATVISSGQILIHDGVDTFDNKSLSGDIQITNQGVATIQANSVVLATDTTGDFVSGVTANQGLLKTGAEDATLGFIDCAANEIMVRNAGDTAWGCGTDQSGSGGTPNVLDLGDDGGNDSIDLVEIATSGDTNNIFTEPSANKLLINLALDWPKADLADAATALAANGGNCPAGSFPLGVDTAVAAENCTDAATQAELNAWTGATSVTTLGTVGTGTWQGTVVDEAYLDTDVAEKDEANTFAIGGQVIDGAATDQIQLRIQGSTGTQSTDTFVVEKSDGTDVFVVNESTGATFGGTSSSITAAAGQNLNIIAATVSQSVRIGDGGTNHVNVTRAGVMTFAGTGEFNLPTSATPTPTSEGRCWWDTDDLFVCGTGAAQQWFAIGSSSGEAANIATNSLAQATDISTTLCSNGQILKNTSGTWGCAADATGGTPDFASITNGTNTGAAMVVSSGASLRAGGTGIVEASHVDDGAGVALTCGATQEGEIQVGTNTSDSIIAYCDSSTTPTLRTGFLDADGTDDDIPDAAADFVNFDAGDGLVNSSGTVHADLNATLDGAGLTTSLSGMEFTATSELALLQGCANDEILKWVDASATWACAADAGAAGGDSITVDTVAVVNPDFASTGDIDFVDTSNVITANINAGVITNADVNASAAIAASKLAISATAPIALSGAGAISITDVYIDNAADDTMTGDLTIDDTDVGTALTVRADSAAAGAAIGLLITTDDNTANYDPFEIRDDSGGANPLLFAIDDTGTITTGLATTAAVGDSDTSIATTDFVDRRVQQECKTIESLVDTTDDNVLMFIPRVAVTIVAVSCQAAAAATVVLEDYGGTAIETIVCETDGDVAWDTSMSGTATLIAGEVMRMDTTSESNPAWTMICFAWTND